MAIHELAARQGAVLSGRVAARALLAVYVALAIPCVTGCVTVVTSPGTIAGGAPNTPGASSAASSPASSAVPTVWDHLGFAQLSKKLRKCRDAMLNRSGNLPGLEATLPLMAIADPENSRSDVPAVRAAAKIKQDDDQSAQAAKAVRYLTQLGCGCYDGTGEVTQALIESLQNCNEEVRYEAAKGIATLARNRECNGCAPSQCCGPELLDRLARMAFEKDACGCWVEPSSRVRRMAEIALQYCRPDCDLQSPRVEEPHADEREVTPPPPPHTDREYLPETEAQTTPSDDTADSPAENLRPRLLPDNPEQDPSLLQPFAVASDPKQQGSAHQTPFSTLKPQRTGSAVHDGSAERRALSDPSPALPSMQTPEQPTDGFAPRRQVPPVSTETTQHVHWSPHRILR